MSRKVKGLMERLRAGEKVICAEGYIFLFERRCYVKAGPFVPEVVLDHPEFVKQTYEEFVKAGSDVVMAFTYYAHREKLALIDREKDIEAMNRTALRLAREVADKTGTLVAGDICNTNAFDPKVPSCRETVKNMFKEQVLWAVEEGADFIVAETFGILEEAMIALEAIKEFGSGLPAVITLAACQMSLSSLDGVDLIECFRRLEAAGADVMGLNCSRGPATMLQLLEKIKSAGFKTPIAAVPVTYRTTEEMPNFHALKDPTTDEIAFPLNLDCLLCSRDDIAKFGRKCEELGINYVGLCCGNSPHLTRSLAESLGRVTPASKFSPNMALHCIYGTDDRVNTYLRKDVKKALSGQEG
ncbi:betaine--homocysteine S-methyltransferase 1 [Strongylocentrotus purpuratus]|uniref:Hcy-binding domain-containing protein n=1 Tax=Strongylocentrotus purpuratus TaxID=7668 RepID=A0A7M7HMG0_STRPU|nr:betaine--homocysteine S-methyltransferase 1 [Strongylocentrotus purpuratus]